MRSSKPLREEHAEITRNAVIAAAKQQFATRGYEAVLLDEIAATARVTKGAIYHHFDNKRDLFRTVYEELAAEMVVRVREQIARGMSPLQRAELALDAFLDCADDEAIRTVMFRDGPIALAGECRVIDARYFLGLLREQLDEFVAAGTMTGIDTALVARLLLGVLIEGSAILGGPERTPATRASMRTALLGMLAGLMMVSPPRR
jgi:AcrR family transcriptional regulator